MSIGENSVPYKLYDAANAASTGSPVYLGKATVAGIGGETQSFFPELAGNNCYKTFLIASLVSGKNMKFTPATADDPYIYIDSRWFIFKPEGGGQKPTSFDDNNILSDVKFNEKDRDIIVTMKTITTTDSVKVIDAQCTIDLSTYRYYCANKGIGLGVYKETRGEVGQEDAAFMFKSLKPGRCITMKDDGHTIIIGLDLDNPECSPCASLGSIVYCNPCLPEALHTDGSVSTDIYDDLIAAYGSVAMQEAIEEQASLLDSFGQSFPGTFL